ncbi:MAG TPA: hypothetical protein VKE74_33040 [Gemmataceae bacterium]|nr:hypothetical protein [Gemmataceae bacterium]
MSRRDALWVGLTLVAAYSILGGLSGIAAGLSILYELSPDYPDAQMMPRMDHARQSVVRGAVEVAGGEMLFLVATWALRWCGDQQRAAGSSVTPPGSEWSGLPFPAD